MFQDWLDLHRKIEATPSLRDMPCPECHDGTVDFQYVGDAETRRGYLDMWCRSCNKGVYLSRLTIPAGAELIDLDRQAAVGARIPYFVQLTPPDETGG